MGLRRYYGPLRRPTRPGGVPRGSPVGRHARPPLRASRVYAGSPFQACRRHYPGRTTRDESLTAPRGVGLPRVTDGSAPAFEVSRPARRSLALRPACSRSPQGTLSIEGFDGFVASAAAPIATGWSDISCRAGFAPAENQRRSRRTVAVFRGGVLTTSGFEAASSRLPAASAACSPDLLGRGRHDGAISPRFPL
jgi:hypothetical protein